MIGIILLNLGGPDSIDAVKPFLFNLFSDREIIRLGPPFLQKTIASLVISMKLKKTLAAYNLIGGKSPLTDITTAQSKALEKLLNKDIERENRRNGESGKQRIGENSFAPIHPFTSSPVRVFVGMRYWHPYTEDSVEQMYKAGITKIIALSLYPHYCIATTGSSIKHFKDAAEKYSIEYSCITSWFNHPLYIDALAARIEQGLKGFSKKPAVLFSAHSLPQKFVNSGDPYIPEIRGTIDALTDKLDLQWSLSYQSKTGPVKWLEPTTEHMLHELAGKGIKDLLVVPISFVSDHIETLYEIDILYKGMAKKLGITLQRIESLNTSGKFIEALADIVLTKAKDTGWIYPRVHKQEREHMPTYDAIIIGAGISGLSFAHYCGREGMRTLIIEKDAHIGGTIHSHRFEAADGFWLELGAHTCYNSYGNLIGLADNCGILDRLIRREKVPFKMLVDNRIKSIPSQLNFSNSFSLYPVCLHSRKWGKALDRTTPKSWAAQTLTGSSALP